MTLEELKRGAAVLPSDERVVLTAFLRHLDRVDTSANGAELSRLDHLIDNGDCVSLEQWRKVHSALESEGL